MKHQHPLLLALIVAAAVAAVQGRNSSCPTDTAVCNNPLIPLLEDEMFGNSSVAVEYLECAEEAVASDICPEEFFTSSQRCCDTSTYQSIYQSHLEGRDELEELLAELESIDTDELFGDLDASIQEIESNPDIPQDIKDAFISYISALARLYEDYFGGLKEPIAQCYTGVSQYMVGLVCLGCESGWDQYITDNNGSLTLALTDQTCTDMTEACSPYLLYSQAFIDNLRDAYESSGMADLGIPGENFTDICTDEASCGEIVCNQMLDGVNITLDIDIFSEDDDGDEKRSLRDIVGDRYSDFTQRYAKYFQPQTPFLRLRDFHAQMAKEYGVEANERSNSYTTSGWPATEVGKASSLETKFDDAAAPLASWYSVVLELWF